MKNNLGRFFVVGAIGAATSLGFVWAANAGASPWHLAAQAISPVSAPADPPPKAHPVVSAAASQKGTPAPVSVVSPILGVMQTGSSVGPGILSGVAVTVVNSAPLPAPGNQAQSDIDSAIVNITGKIAQYGPQGIAELQSAVAGAACANGSINTGIESVAGAANELATSAAPLIDPLNVTIQQVVTLMQSFEEPAGAC